MRVSGRFLVTKAATVSSAPAANVTGEWRGEHNPESSPLTAADRFLGSMAFFDLQTLFRR
jgi:hypothetical protein